MAHGNPRIAELGRDFWEHGRGAAWIRWPEPGSTGRCHRLVMQHAGMGDQEAWGYCAERHHAVLGTWPGEKKGGGKAGPEPAKPLTNKQKKKLKKGRRMFDDDATAALRSSRRGDAIRSVDFALERSGDGLTLSGYAAVFDSPTLIRDALGDFEETIARGAFAASLEARTPVLMFEHGRHPLIGSMPLGIIRDIGEDKTGLHIEARLSDNWLIQPVRDAVRDGSVTGMSFRFSVPEAGEQWKARPGLPDQRTIRAADVTELGPVVFPAYQPTTASIRSQLEQLPVVELRECGCGCDGTCGEGRTTDITAGPDTRGAGGGDPRNAGQGDAHQPSTTAQARHRDLLMKGIIRG